MDLSTAAMHPGTIAEWSAKCANRSLPSVQSGADHALRARTGPAARVRATGSHRTVSARPAGRDHDTHLTRAETLLLLSAFLTLTASIVALVTL